MSLLGNRQVDARLRSIKWVGVAALPLIFGGLVRWARSSPPLPDFVETHEHEVMAVYLAGTYRRSAATVCAVNVHCPIEKLLPVVRRMMNSNDVTLTRDFWGYFVRGRNHGGALLDVQLTEGRFNWAKSFNYYDRQHRAGFADGWTAVHITYRPDLRSWARSCWTEVVAPHFGSQDNASRRVLVVDGLVAKGP